MGMAASQARFLGLTARKSNVEYQGQQVNQQRTALANESANLYNQMMTLNVPTPPATTDFYTTTYELENSKVSYDEENYTFQNAVKTFNHENEYSVTLIHKTENITDVNYTNAVGKPSKETKDENTIYTFPITTNNGKGSMYELSYNANDLSTVDESGKQKDLSTFQLYTATDKIQGYAKCCTEKDDQGNIKDYYFYQDRKGQNHFILKSEVDAIISAYDKDETIPTELHESYANVYYKEDQQTVIGTLETSSNGRFSTIKIDNNESYPAELAGKTFALNVKQIFDEDGYNDAMNDYTYQKDVYEQAINEINAKTEKIQKQDQNLELRLDQLDTEQNAIKTEMDAVTKVLKDNVEKTFKTFNA